MKKESLNEMLAREKGVCKVTQLIRNSARQADA